MSLAAEIEREGYVLACTSSLPPDPRRISSIIKVHSSCSTMKPQPRSSTMTNNFSSVGTRPPRTPGGPQRLVWFHCSSGSITIIGGWRRRKMITHPIRERLPRGSLFQLLRNRSSLGIKKLCTIQFRWTAVHTVKSSSKSLQRSSCTHIKSFVLGVVVH